MTDTPLGLELKQRIAEQGPMGVDAFMAACLYDEEHGYYTRGRNFLPGPDGVEKYPHDFTTAPELTPVFGRTLANWVVRVWKEVGSPTPFTLMEAGPGRGVLMRDMLGELREGFPEVFAVVKPVLVEVSAALTDLQKETLRDFPQCEWRRDAAVEGPSILVANELLDAFPYKQLVDGRERLVEWGSQGFRFSGSQEGVIDERSPAMEAWLRWLPEGLVAACFLDYGAEAEVSGDTLQGVYRHTKVSVFERPGEVDLTCHVNFKHVVAAMGEIHKHLEAEPLQTLMAFLMGNGLAGIALSGARGKVDALGSQGVEESILERLLHPAQMGTLFKVQTFKTCSTRTRP